MYQALYRKWRPKTFSQVVGQDPVSYTHLDVYKRQGQGADLHGVHGDEGGLDQGLLHLLVEGLIQGVAPGVGHRCV